MYQNKVNSSLVFNCNCKWLLRSDDGDGNENGIKAIGLD